MCIPCRQDRRWPTRIAAAMVGREAARGSSARCVLPRPGPPDRGSPHERRPQIVPPAGIAVIGLGNMGVPMGARPGEGRLRGTGL